MVLEFHPYLDLRLPQGCSSLNYCNNSKIILIVVVVVGVVVVVVVNRDLIDLLGKEA